MSDKSLLIINNFKIFEIIFQIALKYIIQKLILGLGNLII